VDENKLDRKEGKGKSSGNGKIKQQIPPLRCGMTNKAGLFYWRYSVAHCKGGLRFTSLQEGAGT
jgi:hypothetical protein